jgi:RsiW-degrading membrane proteinase PrsW (M82 family)
MVFFFRPMLIIFWVYMLVALLPAVGLMAYIYRLDNIEHEPIGLLLKLALFGGIAAVISGFLETIGQKLLSFLQLDTASPVYTILLAFLVVAFVEEGVKFFFLYRGSWKNPNFDYTFDAVVYSAAVSMGFAALENVMYVFGFGLSVGFMRAFLSIPGHLAFGILAGFFYGRAKEREKAGWKTGAYFELFTGLLLAIVLHGLYDMTAMLGNTTAILCFVIIVAVIYLIVFRMVRKAADEDHPL